MPNSSTQLNRARPNSFHVKSSVQGLETYG
uniref:Uncharacterized protein n=1 Tax=Rhizophora mucronata TaxID=61149 RepID=A0A2P2QJI5_RHIMU